MNKKTIIALVITFILLVALGIGVYLILHQQGIQEKAAPATTISIQPSSKTMSVGDSADFTVQMDTTTNTVTTVTLEINYNPTVLSIDSVSSGTFLPIVLSTPRIDSTTGTIKATFGTDPSSPQKGVGTVATLKVKAKGPGTSPITFGSGTTASGVSESLNIIAVKTPATVVVATGTSQNTADPSLAAATATPVATPFATLAPSTGSTTTSTSSATIATSSASVKVKPTVNLPANKIVKPGQTLDGTATPNVNLSITTTPGAITGSAIADALGSWTYTLPSTITTGSHSMTVKDTNGLSTTVSFTVATGEAPVSGFEIPTYIFVYGGILMTIVGFGLALKN